MLFPVLFYALWRCGGNDLGSLTCCARSLPILSQYQVVFCGPTPHSSLLPNLPIWVVSAVLIQSAARSVSHGRGRYQLKWILSGSQVQDSDDAMFINLVTSVSIVLF
ncbi:hypothetical protein BJV74DRAFT_841579 [Russula compacta]|nr:hypothetical protein BJV74DRAFT_841579 [Russula compacta]